MEDRRDAVARMVAAGVLSPAALGMDPGEALEQHAEACAFTPAERRALAERFGLRPDLMPPGGEG